MPYTTANLLSSAEIRSFMPANALTFSVAEQLAMADEVMESEILRSILDVSQDYYTIPVDIPVVANQAAYPIPSRAFSSIIREVQLVRDNRISDLERVQLEDALRTSTGEPKSFYLRQDKVVLYPTPSGSDFSLRLYVDIEPGSFVQTSSTAVISAIDTVNFIVTVAAIPDDWASGDTFDFISKGGSHAYVAINQVSDVVTGAAITFTTLPSDLVVGDFVVREGESSVVQAPTAYRSVLTQGLAALMLRNSNQPGADSAHQRFHEKLRIAQGIIAGRVTGELEDIVPRNWI